MYENNVYYSDNDKNQRSNCADTGSSTTGAYSGAQSMNNDSYYQSYNYDSSYNNSYSNHYGSSYNGSYGKKPEKKKSGLAVKAVTFAVCGALFGVCAGAGFYGIVFLNKYMNGNQEVVVESSAQELPAQSSAAQLTTSTETKVITADVTEVVEDVMPAMVSIINKYYVQTSSFWGQTFTQPAQSSGSGIIIAQDETELLIATNYHVIEDAETLEVTFIDGSTAAAKIKGKDSGMDLAVIAIPLNTIELETRQAITVAQMGDSEELKLGEPVIAIGNALGYGQSVTGGWVSALNREVGMEDGSKGIFIQTDAAINGGNSGGALLNMNGEVIGINSSKISGYGVEGMGYAIPISAAEPIISDLMTKETKEKVEDGNVGYLGISPQTVTSEMSSYFRCPVGIMVLEVESGSPAEAAGILSRDIITNFDGEKITDYDDLQDALQYCGPGTVVDIIVERVVNGQYEPVEVEITLGERPEK